MKKLIFSLVMILALSTVAFAVVTPPSVAYKTWGATSDKYGSYAFSDNGNVYRLVYKTAGNDINAGSPLFYVATTNTYTVTSEPASADISDNLAGILYCTTTGTTSSIGKAAKYVWMQTNGYYATARISMEGTATPAGAILTGVAGKNHLTVLRAAGAGVATGEGGKKIVNQVAITTDGAISTTGKVFLKGL